MGCNSLKTKEGLPVNFCSCRHIRQRYLSSIMQDTGRLLVNEGVAQTVVMAIARFVRKVGNSLEGLLWHPNDLARIYGHGQPGGSKLGIITCIHGFMNARSPKRLSRGKLLRSLRNHSCQNHEVDAKLMLVLRPLQLVFNHASDPQIRQHIHSESLSLFGRA